MSIDFVDFSPGSLFLHRLLDLPPAKFPHPQRGVSDLRVGVGYDEDSAEELFRNLRRIEVWGN
jgi:predicted YcjX-like family ATPase